MAPNKRSIASLTATLSNVDLQSLQDTVQPKFLPLTHPSEQQQTQQDTKSSLAATAVSASYWDWPADQPTEQVNVLSLSNIESNLVQAAQKEDNKEYITVAGDDSYWAEQAQEEPVHVSKPQHVESPSYWEWTSEQDFKKQTIKHILRDEQARQLVSGQAIQQNLMRAAAPQEAVQVQTEKVCNDFYWAWESPVSASHVNDASHPNADYWTWNVEKKSPVDAIMEYEAARQMLSVAHIVRNLQSQQLVDSPTCADSDDYWNEPEDLGDCYWDAAPQQQQSVATGGYWDM
jgi:hypothetical protein